LNNRVYSKIDDSISRGKNLIYLYGEVNLLTDLFFYDIKRGLLNIDETLKYYFLTKKGYDYFISYNSENQFKFCDNKCQEIEEKKFYEENKAGKGPIRPPKKLNDQGENEKEVEEATNNINKFDNTLHRIEKEVKKGEKRVGLFLEGFEYIAKLYGENDISKVQILENLYKLSNLTTIVSMKDPIERLKVFDIHLDKKSVNLVNIGYPNKDEIFNSYVYKILSSRSHDPNINIIDISENLSSSKLSLKNTLNILDEVLRKSKSISLDKFNEFLNKNIEEEITFKDVIIDEGIKKNIIDMLEEFLEEDSKHLKKGVILTGPPGTGKTHLVKAMANEFNMYFSAPSLAELKGEYIGESSANVKRLFDELRNNQPSILFLDELDSIFSIRGGRQTDSYTNDIINQFLVEIDGVKSGDQKIFIIGATNRIEVVDSAIKSRLGVGINIPLPNRESRIRIFNSKFDKFTINDLEVMKEGFKDEFIKKTKGFSGRDIDNFVKDLKRGKENEQFTLDEINLQLESKEKEYKDNFERIMKDSINVDVPEKTNIIGYKSILDELEEESNYIKSSHLEKVKLNNFKIEISRGTILYGPPGNGKTELVSFIANKNNFYLVRVLSKSFVSLSFEDTLRKLKDIFENTIKLANITSKDGIILFFDEIETLIGRTLDPQVRGTILDYLQDNKGIRDRNSKIMFFGATNFFESLDEASVRKGRIDKKIMIENPSIDAYIELLINFWSIDKTIYLKISKNDSNINKIIDRYILLNFNEKNGIEVLINKRYKGIRDYHEFINEFIEKSEKDKLKEIKDSGVNICSISDIKDLARKIKRFAYYKGNNIKEDKLIIDEDILKYYFESQDFRAPA
jgi:transitional endoplasmic reticulum ATPase